MAAPVKPERLTDCPEHRALDWEDRRCAVIISGSQSLRSEWSPRCPSCKTIREPVKWFGCHCLARGCPLDRSRLSPSLAAGCTRLSTNVNEQSALHFCGTHRQYFIYLLSASCEIPLCGDSFLLKIVRRQEKFMIVTISERQQNYEILLAQIQRLLKILNPYALIRTGNLLEQPKRYDY